MTAAYTFDVFCSLDGFGSHRGNWGGYWPSKAPSCSPAASSDVGDPWVGRMRSMPATVVSTTLQGPLDWTRPS